MRALTWRWLILGLVSLHCAEETTVINTRGRIHEAGLRLSQESGKIGPDGSFTISVPELQRPQQEGFNLLSIEADPVDEGYQLSGSVLERIQNSATSNTAIRISCERLTVGAVAAVGDANKH